MIKVLIGDKFPNVAKKRHTEEFHYLEGLPATEKKIDQPNLAVYTKPKKTP